ncbi:573_t:CDS:2 [Funneliformis caledonium]|uniref:573_t:CDS:1 n=1 Tax=Funneliformis caledonium TaxID=1117310 RepID=A0A9N8Z721_9GLOM|nr:573_t:CDS:2 [Funneliformis caledonium]
MAKSMRSKVKRRFRAIKRQSVFEPAEAARAQRLAANQVQAAGPQQMNSTSIKKEGSQDQLPPQLANTYSTTDITSGSLCYEILGLIDPDIIDSTNFEGLMSMVIDTDAPKISTSGPRNSRHQQWKRKKLAGKKKFAGKKKRNVLVHF